MTRLLILYASQTETGRVRRMVDALVAAAAEETAVETRVLRADRAEPADVRAARGMLLLTPEHFGYMAGKLKDFFDRSFYPLEGQTVGLPYGLIVSAGNDGRGTVSAVERIVEGYRWKAVVPPLIVRGTLSEADRVRLHEIGLTLAVGLAVGAF